MYARHGVADGAHCANPCHAGRFTASGESKSGHGLACLRWHARFGRRSEKLDPEQLLLALEDIEQAVAGNEAADDKKDPVARNVG
jgi:hypothetical protein